MSSGKRSKVSVIKQEGSKKRMGWLTVEEVDRDQIMQSLVSYAKISHLVLSAVEVKKRNLSSEAVQSSFYFKKSLWLQMKTIQGQI